MIRRDRKRAVRHLITAYDLEWREEPRADGRSKRLITTLAGAYDERGYRKYVDCDGFLRGELVPGNAGRRYYAHFGGGADMVFLLRELAKLPPSYVVSGAFSGSAAIVVRVKRDDLEWLFLDSFWTLRVRLATIGKWLGFPAWKGDTRKMSFAELATYNEQDCVVLYQAMRRTQETILEVGGELGVTIASTAMKTFLRKYLKKPIKNRAYLDSLARAAYVASRVEVIRPACQQANYYDINSSFPYSFTSPCPGSQVGFSRDTLPTRDVLWIADVDLEVPDDCYLPAIPFRHGGRTFFPRGAFRTSITSEDFKAGEFKILKVHACTEFEDRDDLRAFAEEFYELRKRGGFESKVYKICVNGLYGKWAEREEKTVLLVNPAIRCPFTQELLAPGIVIQHEIKPVPHSHVPMSAMITARSRRYLLEGMRDTAKRGKIYYADTDSIVCDADLPTGDKLGQWKHEYRIEEGRFMSQKLYAMRLGEIDARARAKDADAGSWADMGQAEKDAHGRLVKAKGFSRVIGFDGGDEDDNDDTPDPGHQTDSRPMTYPEFIALTEGARVKIERMLRIRELTAKDGSNYEPRSIVMTKGLNLRIGTDGVPIVRPKRELLPDGDSRPWRVDELMKNK